MRLHRIVLLVAAAFVATFSTGAESRGTISVAEDQRLLKVHKYPTNDEERVGIAPSVTTEQINAWLKKGETADDVFKQLALHNAADDVLASPILQEWVGYMKLFNQKFPKKQTSLISTLTSNYGDDRLAKMIQVAKRSKVPETANMAKRLEFEQIHRWLGQQETPEKVFLLLKLDDVGVEPFLQPQMVTWAKYIDSFDKANPGTKAALLPAFGRYNEQSMVNMLIAAKTVPSTEHIAVRAQVELTQLWLRIERTPEEIFAMLKLGQAGDNVLESPLFIAWMKYTDDFNEMYVKKYTPAMTTLLKYYTDESMAKMVLEAEKAPGSANVAKQLQSELLENWLRSKKSPSSVFRVLKLNKAGDKAFESPVLAMWLKYVAFFKDANPLVRVNVAEILKRYYANDVLGKMLIEALKVPSTKKIAKSTLDALTIGWMYQKVKPEMVYKWLLVDGTAADDVGRKLYKSYNTLYHDKYPNAFR
ncbi:hypothetical protein PR001_g13529 [Phytophthora rubi]|uniref:RxLR effector PexRD54 WY domain-containing protein n=1 Tax=Phytophthora rubi TaxID=129364 RepID=A0A6A3LRG4_9STRA|nr:hypothetical protein PR001_g13529 [Phytophthora rubi]